MATTQYIGARYVPLFADPTEWNSTRTYEPLTIVMNKGNSYTSKQYVPKGIDILNEDFWALTGNYNAQVEQYRKDVLSFDERISTNKNAITAEVTRAKAAEQKSADAITAEVTRAKAAEQKSADAINTVSTDLATEVTRAKKYEANITPISYRTQNLVIVGDSWTEGYTESTGTGYVQQLKDLKFFKSVTTYSEGGTGWIAGSHKYLAQTQKIINDYKDKPEQLNIVMYVGSVNDLSSSSDAIKDAASACFNAMRTAFPNVQMYAVANITKGISQTDLNKMEAPLSAIRAYGGIPLYWPARLLTAHYTYFTSDGYHIKHNLCLSYAHNIINNMLGFFTFPSHPDTYRHFTGTEITFNSALENTSYDTTYSFQYFNERYKYIFLKNITFKSPTSETYILTIDPSLLAIRNTIYETQYPTVFNNFVHTPTSYDSTLYKSSVIVNEKTGRLENPCPNAKYNGNLNIGSCALVIDMITQQYLTAPILH